MFSRLFFVFAIFMGPFSAFAGEEMNVDEHQVYDPVDEAYEDITPKGTLNVNRSAKYGVLGNIGRSVTGGSSVAAGQFQLDQSDIDSLLHGSPENARERNELLGCSTMDYHASVITSLNNDETQIEEYVSSPMGTYMLTTLLNSPAIASTFNTVEAFGSKRVQLMQDRCQAMQADATVSAEGMMRWQALQACVHRNVESSLNITDSTLSGSPRNEREAVAVAVAYRACLYGSQGQQNGFGADPVEAMGATVPSTVNASLEGALKADVLDFDGDNPSLWTGTLFHALRNTAFCEMRGGRGVSGGTTDATDDADCRLMAMIPNVRWCAGSEMVDRHCLSDSKVRMSRATFTPQQVFDLIFAFTEMEVAYRDKFAQLLATGVGDEIAEEIATKGEVLYNPMVNRTADDAAVDNIADESRVFAGCIANGTTEGAEDFSEYIDRAIALSTTDDLAADTVVSRTPMQELSDFQADIEGQVAPPSIFSVLSSDIINTAEIEGQRSAMVAPDLADQMYNVATFAQITADAARCVMKHHTRLTLMDHLKLADLPDGERMGALLAVRMNIAQTTTELLYRHLKEKLMFAKLDMQNGGSVSSRRATPPHVLASMETLIKIIDNQLDHMSSMRGRQREMSGLLSSLRRDQ